MNTKPNVSKMLSIIAALASGSALVVTGACFGDSVTYDYEPITDCSNVPPGVERMCSYRIYTPSLTLCVTKTEETSYDCVTEVQYECPFEYYVNGTCTSENTRCTGGSYATTGTNYNITVMKRLIYCPPQG